MKFKKNKSKVICFYIIAFSVLSLFLWMIIELLVKDKDKTKFFVFEMIFLVASIIMSIKALISELKQTVNLNGNNIKCENFFVAGNLADATFEYNQIKSIQLKRSLFSVCLVIKVEGSENFPVVLNNQFENYTKLWQVICDGCKSQNPNAYIDCKIWDFLNKFSK